MSLYLIVVLILHLYTQVFLRVQFLALCFSPCILSLCLPLSTHTIILHSFADDLQLQMSAPPDKMSELLHSMQLCMSDVKAWASENMPRLNDVNKTHVCYHKKNYASPYPTYFNHYRQCSNSLQTVCEEFGFYIRLSS